MQKLLSIRLDFPVAPLFVILSERIVEDTCDWISPLLSFLRFSVLLQSERERGDLKAGNGKRVQLRSQDTPSIVKGCRDKRPPSPRPQ